MSWKKNVQSSAASGPKELYATQSMIFFLFFVLPTDPIQYPQHCQTWHCNKCTVIEISKGFNSIFSGQEIVGHSLSFPFFPPIVQVPWFEPG